MGAGRLAAWKARQESARTNNIAYTPVAATNWQRSTTTRTPAFPSASSSLVQRPQLDKPLSAKVRINIGTVDNPIFLVGKLANVRLDGNCFFNALQQSALTWKANSWEACSSEDNTIGKAPIKRQAIDWEYARDNLTMDQKDWIENVDIPDQRTRYFNKQNDSSFTLQDYFNQLAKNGTHIPVSKICEVISKHLNMDIIVGSLNAGAQMIPDENRETPIDINVVAKFSVNNPERKAIIISNGVESSSGHFFAFVPENFNSANDNADPLQEYQDLAKETAETIVNQFKGLSNWFKNK